jgi:hypothetical protein
MQLLHCGSFTSCKKLRGFFELRLRRQRLNILSMGSTEKDSMDALFDLCQESGFMDAFMLLVTRHVAVLAPRRTITGGVP